MVISVLLVFFFFFGKIVRIKYRRRTLYLSPTVFHQSKKCFQSGEKNIVLKLLLGYTRNLQRNIIVKSISQICHGRVIHSAGVLFIYFSYINIIITTKYITILCFKSSQKDGKLVEILN